MKLTDMMVVGTDKIEKSITGAAFNIPLGYFFKRDGKNVDSTPLYEGKHTKKLVIIGWLVVQDEENSHSGKKVVIWR